MLVRKHGISGVIGHGTEWPISYGDAHIQQLDLVGEDEIVRKQRNR